jgi:hypothetical protein
MNNVQDLGVVNLRTGVAAWFSRMAAVRMTGLIRTKLPTDWT